MQIPISYPAINVWPVARCSQLPLRLNDTLTWHMQLKWAVWWKAHLVWFVERCSSMLNCSKTIWEKFTTFIKLSMKKFMTKTKFIYDNYRIKKRIVCLFFRWCFFRSSLQTILGVGELGDCYCRIKDIFWIRGWLPYCVWSKWCQFSNPLEGQKAISVLFFL